MEINLRRLDQGFHLEAVNESGNTVHTDGSEAIGGAGNGMRPMQLMLVGIGSCSAIDIIQFLKKQRQPLDDIQIRVTAEREQDVVPALFTTIHVSYQLYGDLDPKKVERAVRLSMEKYCSVAKILEKSAEITYEYHVHPTEG
jgi:putative redox protein